MGALLALIVSQWPKLLERAGRGLSTAGVGALALCFVAWNSVVPNARFFRGGDLIFAFVAAVLIASAVQPASVVRSVLSIQPLRFIGKISYGLYLWHWPVIVYMTPERIGLDGAALDILRVAVTVVITLGSFVLVEQPILRGALPRVAARVMLPAASATVLLAVVIGTAGSGPPPRFYGRTGTGPGLCLDAQPREVVDAEGKLRELGTAHTPDPGELRILVIGDSRACSLLTGLETLGGVYDVPVGDGTVLGCGVVSGIVADVIVPRDFSAACPELAENTQAEAFAEVDPNMIVWWSNWEGFNILDDAGNTLIFGTPEHDALLLSRMEDVLARLGATGAHFTILTNAPIAGNTDASLPEKIDHMNNLYRQFAALHPDQVRIFELADLVCPGGAPCPVVIDGFAPRLEDGLHLSAQGSAWVARAVLPQLAAASGRTGWSTDR